MCEDQGFAVQPQAPPAWLHLQVDLVQLAEESSDEVSLRGKVTKSSITDVLPWGHHSPHPWLLCHSTLCQTPAVVWPTESSAVPQCAGALTLLQSLSQLPALFLSAVVPSVSWSEHAAWGTQGDNLAHKSVQYRSRSFQSSRTIPWPHQEPPSSQVPQVQEDCQQNHCTNAMMNTVLWESGGATISGAVLWTSASLGGLDKTVEHTTKPATHLDSRPSVWSHGGRVQRSESCFPSTATCLSVPPKYPKVPLNNHFPTSSIFIREEVTWESSCPPTWKGRAHGENAALRACTLSLTPATRAFWQTTNPRFNLPLYILALVLQILAQLLRLFFSKPNACQTSSARTRFLLGLWLMLIFKNRKVGTSWSEMKLHFKRAEKAKMGQKLILPISDYLNK